MEVLAVPLLASQVEAANNIHRRLQQWAAADGALQLLTDRFPGFGREETLLKVAAINQLYGTNLFAVVRMAKHVTSLMASAPKKDPSLVEQMSCLPIVPGQQSQRRHVSFASKFSHFFVDRDRFPIYDSYATKTLARHLGRRLLLKNADHPYQTYVANFNLLREQSRLDCSTRELDVYLWLAGVYRKWRARPDAKINAEALSIFANPSMDVAINLERLS